MSASHNVIGADGGGTKTLVVLADEGGRELARCTVGASNPNVVGIDTAGERLIEAVRECCGQAGRDIPSVRSAVFGLAGAGNIDNRKGILARLHAAFGFGFQAEIVTDARIALEGAHAGRPGIVVIAGTGSVVCAKTPEGETVTVGGWGRSLGDDGSGFFLGMEAAKAVTRALDGVQVAGRMVEALKERYSWASREQLIQSVYRDRLELSTLAPFVLDAARGGDTASLEILRRGAAALAEQVLVAARSITTPSIPLATIGGLIDHPTVYRDILIDEMRKRDSRIRPTFAERHPVDGAVIMALEAPRGASA